jgi:hypothetical protein
MGSGQLTKTVKVTVPVALVAAVIVAVTGHNPHALNGAQVSQYIAALLAGAAAVLHGPAVKKAAKKAAHKVKPKRPAQPLPAIVDAMDTIGGDASNIPRSCKRVLAYITGSGGIAWTMAQIKAAATHAEVIAIDQSDGTFSYRSYKTLILDCEPGAKSNANAVIQVRVRAQLGLRTVLYTFAANVQALSGAIAAAGLSQHVDGYVANWNLNREQAIAYLHANPTVVGVQWASPTSNPDTIAPGTGRTLRELNIDLSVTRGSWPSG